MSFKNTLLRYFIRFSYQGRNFHGWQIQPNAVTVQEILEDRLSKILGERISVTGAGRTDTGVHASEMFAHFDAEITDKENLVKRLNSFLPPDIAIQNIIEVKSSAHARFDATERTYHYYIHYDKNPFKTDVSWYWFYGNLDLVKMNSAASKLLEFYDFSSFARLHADNKTNICNIKEAFWEDFENGLKFTITADRFLRNMVRSLVGTLVLVGQGKITEAEFIEIIRKKDRKFAAASAPAHGLFLAEVKYPDDIFI